MQGVRCSRRGEASNTALRAVIFDMDGVLVDSEPVHFEAIHALMARHGATYATAHDEDFYGCTDRDVFAVLRARYHLAAPVEQLCREWIDLVVALLPGRAAPMRGVPDVLQVLGGRGLDLALASSSAPEIIRTTLDEIRLSDAFLCTVSGHEVERAKPAPDVFLETARRLGVPPAACLVVEDSRNGLLAALAAGMRCVVVPCVGTAGQDLSGAETRLDTLEDLPGWLADRGGSRRVEPREDALVGR